jgi:hypothetical protein
VADSEHAFRGFFDPAPEDPWQGIYHDGYQFVPFNLTINTERSRAIQQTAELLWDQACFMSRPEATGSAGGFLPDVSHAFKQRAAGSSGIT